MQEKIPLYTGKKQEFSEKSDKKRHLCKQKEALCG
jgi:hypothetical protein